VHVSHRTRVAPEPKCIFKGLERPTGFAYPRKGALNERERRHEAKKERGKN